MADAAGVTMSGSRKATAKRHKHGNTRRELYLYSGCDCFGRVILNEKTCNAKAFDSQGKALGEFSGFDAAADAVWRSAPPLPRKRA
jgi:hypothetical protein